MKELVKKYEEILKDLDIELKEIYNKNGKNFEILKNNVAFNMLLAKKEIVNKILKDLKGGF